MLRAVQVVVDEGLARADPGRPAGGDRAAHRALRPAPQARARTSRSSIPSSDPRYREYWTEYHRLTRAPRRVAGRSRKIEMRRRTTLIGAMMVHMRRGRRHAVRHVRHATTRTCATSTRSSACAAGVNHYAAMNAADAAQAHGVHLRHLRQLRSDAPSRSPRSTVLAAEEIRRFGIDAEGRAAVALELRHAATRRSASKMREALALHQRDRARPRGRRRDARRRGARRGDAPAAFPELAAEGRREPADHADARRREHRVQPAEGRRRATASRSARSCSARPSRCTS